MQHFVVIGEVYIELEHSKFGRISNSIEISSVGRAPRTLSCGQDSATHLKIAHPHMKTSGARSLNEMQ